MATTVAPGSQQDFLVQLWNYTKTNFIADVSADVYPDADAVLAAVESDGLIGLLKPDVQLSIQALFLKLQADGLKLGDDLVKQEATFFRMYFKAKFAPPAAAPATAAAA